MDCTLLLLPRMSIGDSEPVDGESGSRPWVLLHLRVSVHDDSLCPNRACVWPRWSTIALTPMFRLLVIRRHDPLLTVVLTNIRWCLGGSPVSVVTTLRGVKVLRHLRLVDPSFLEERLDVVQTL